MIVDTPLKFRLQTLFLRKTYKFAFHMICMYLCSINKNKCVNVTRLDSKKIFTFSRVFLDIGDKSHKRINKKVRQDYGMLFLINLKGFPCSLFFYSY